MNIPEWTKPGVYGAIAGAIAISIIGFNWGGWTTSGTAQKMANTQAAQAVTRAMVPICLNASGADPDRAAKLVTLTESTGFNRRRVMMETGWANLPGTDTGDRDLAAACVDGLELDG